MKSRYCCVAILYCIARHWATKGVTIQVCTQADGSSSLQNCQSLPTKNPGPDTVQLPQVSSLTDVRRFAL